MTSASHGKYGHEGRAELVPMLPRGPMTLLDVGSGYGAFGRTIRDLRPDIVADALEPDREAATAAQGHYRRVIIGGFPNALPAERYDVVTFNDVLEHFVDPWDALRQLRSSLSDNGVVIASIPNIRYAPILWDLIRHGRWDYVDVGTLDRTHLRFFTRSSIIDLFESTGYEVEEIFAVNPAMGRRWRWLSIAPKSVRDLQFLQYAVRARPVGSTTSGEA